MTEDSEYERLRAANIRENERRMHELGLAPTPKPVKRQKKNGNRCNVAADARRSDRLRNVLPLKRGLTDDTLRDEVARSLMAEVENTHTFAARVALAREMVENERAFADKPLPSDARMQALVAARVRQLWPRQKHADGRPPARARSARVDRGGARVRGRFVEPDLPLMLPIMPRVG